MAQVQLDRSALFDVQGQVAVVTGGGTGIGLMIAATLEHNGATVYIVGRRLEVLEKAAKENNKHGKIIPLQGDVTSREALLAIVERITQEVGYVNILVNNSGVMYNQAKAPAPGEDIKGLQERMWNAGTAEEFTKTFEVNVTGVYYTSVAFLELLDQGNKRASPDAPRSQIITVSSIAAFRRDSGTFSLSYGPSKAAVLHMAKLLMNTLVPFQIRSNIIAPGLYPSEMTQSLISAQDKPSQAQVPLERYGTAQDMGGLVMFLASKAGAYINGGVHLSDGGRLGLFASTF